MQSGDRGGSSMPQSSFDDQIRSTPVRFFSHCVARLEVHGSLPPAGGEGGAAAALSDPAAPWLVKDIAMSQVSVGRATWCDISVPFPRLSRHHFSLYFVNGQFFIEDVGGVKGGGAGSANGTFIDEGPAAFPITPLHLQRLRLGQRISIGRSGSLWFVLRDGDVAANAADNLDPTLPDSETPNSTPHATPPLPAASPRAVAAEPGVEDTDRGAHVLSVQGASERRPAARPPVELPPTILVEHSPQERAVTDALVEGAATRTAASDTEPVQPLALPDPDATLEYSLEQQALLQEVAAGAAGACSGAPAAPQRGSSADRPDEPEGWKVEEDVLAMAASGLPKAVSPSTPPKPLEVAADTAQRLMSQWSMPAKHEGRSMCGQAVAPSPAAAQERRLDATLVTTEEEAPAVLLRHSTSTHEQTRASVDPVDAAAESGVPQHDGIGVGVEDASSGVEVVAESAGAREAVAFNSVLSRASPPPGALRRRSISATPRSQSECPTSSKGASAEAAAGDERAHKSARSESGPGKVSEVTERTPSESVSPSLPQTTPRPAVAARKGRPPRKLPSSTALESGPSAHAPSADEAESLAQLPKLSKREATTTLPSPKCVKAVWQYKSDLRLKNERDAAWTSYADAESHKIEEAFIKFGGVPQGKNSRFKELKLNGTYGIFFPDMVQFRLDDRDRQRPVRRVDAPGP